MKGGVGKTTLCFEISYELSRQGHSVLLIDIDPQANLTQAALTKFKYSEIDKKRNRLRRKNILTEDQKKILEKEEEDVEKILKNASIDKIFNERMIPSLDQQMIKLQENLFIIPAELDIIFLQRSSNEQNAVKLLNFIKDNNIQEQFDYIFIDCPPTYSFYTVSAIYCSDYYFIPVTPSYYSAMGVDLLEQVVAEVVSLNKNSIFQSKEIRNLGIIFTMVDVKAKPRQTYFMDSVLGLEVVKTNQIYVFGSKYTYSNKLATSSLEKQIMDTKDGKLKLMMSEIVKEFKARIENYEN